VGRFALAFLAGLCCVHVLPRLPDSSFVIVLLIGIAAASILRANLLIVFALGIAWAWAHASARLADDLPRALEGEDLLVTGVVSSLPDLNDRDVRFALDVTQAAAGAPSRILLTWYDAEALPRTGESWQLLVRLKRRNGFANPGGFDYEAQLFRNGIGATGYVRADSRNCRIEAAGFRRLVDQARQFTADRMASAVGSEGRMLGVLQGLAIGDTREMTTEQWRVFAATGTTHLMAISGLHISMLAAIAAWLGGAIVRWRGAQARGWCAVHGQAIAGSAAAIGYSLMAGFSIPTQRTALMLCIYFIARWYRRDIQVGHALGLALIGVLLIDPFAPLAVGAWLSFGAVAILVLALSGRLKRMGAGQSFVRAQLAITIGLLPMLLAAFGTMSLVSPFANAVAIPAFTFLVVPLVLLGALFAVVTPVLGALPLTLATGVLELLWRPLEWLASQPFALWYFPLPHPFSLFAMCVGGIVCVLPLIWPIRLLGLACSAHLFFVSAATPARGDFEIAVLDVGQGLSVVVRTERHTLVYDTGPAFQSGRDAASLAVLPYLRARGVRSIDMLMVSHGDLDHRGGLESLFEGSRVGRAVLGPSVEASIPNAERCERGDTWVWDEVRFEVLHPADAFAATDNDSSCVLRIESVAGSTLLTGDIEASGEGQMVRAGVAVTDIVVMPHHGSRTSSTESFVAALAPKVAIASVGYRNRWGLPKADVLERWRQHGARIYTTERSGAIEILIARERPLLVREHREWHRRYWSRTAHDESPQDEPAERGPRSVISESW
jgi:competence protein ComEC